MMSDLGRGMSGEGTADMIERAIRTMAIAIALAGALIALAIYWRPAPPRYQIVTVGDQVVRLNMHSGTMVACNVQKCGFVIHESRGIDENRGFALLPPQGSPAPAQPAPKALAPPTAPAAPSPAAAPRPKGG